MKKRCRSTELLRSNELVERLPRNGQEDAGSNPAFGPAVRTPD